MDGLNNTLESNFLLYSHLCYGCKDPSDQIIWEGEITLKAVSYDGK